MAQTTLDGFLRVAAAIPPVRVADVRANAESTLSLWRRAHREGVHVAWFPELGLTGYSAGDLFHDSTLRRGADDAVAWLAHASHVEGLAPVIVVGLPVWTSLGAFNCAVAIHRGTILAAVPKTFLPTYGEFYEARHFRSGRDVAAGAVARIGGALVPFGTDLLLLATTDTHHAVNGDDEACLIGTEICEDGWVATTPGARHAAAGALVVGNVSGSPFSVGRSEARHRTCWKQSAPNLIAYVYAAAGPGESSADLAFDAHGMIYEAGTLLAESQRFAREAQLVVADVDLDGLRRARVRTGTFGDAAATAASDAKRYRHIPFTVNMHPAREATLSKGQLLPPSSAVDQRHEAVPSPGPGEGADDVSHLDGSVARYVQSTRRPRPIHVSLPLRRNVDPAPYVPASHDERAARCWEVFEIQVNALVTRMTHFGNRHLVLALSGGRDSTLAALACVGALDAMKLPRAHLTCVSMPGWGTTATTREASAALAHALGATYAEEEIGAECELILEAQGHPAIHAWRAAQAAQATDGSGDHLPFATFLGAHPRLADVELENVQARVRKLRVLTRANRGNALEIGTGDLSEKALGWSTFAGDQIALYDVNCGVPKSLVSAVIRWVADERVAREAWSAPDARDAGSAAALQLALEQVLAAPITPELIPPGPDGTIVQRTELTLGPFAVHDFFLHHLIGQGASPSRTFALAQIAFSGQFDASSLRAWLRTFLVRFFRSQWKRDATPDGPKVLPLGLSPRGDWRMPSEAVPDLWLAEVDAAMELDPTLLR
jgi:NAD+ synthase (glutamine-hydrolysing)